MKDNKTSKLLERIEQLEARLKQNDESCFKSDSYSIDWLRKVAPSYLTLNSPNFHSEICQSLGKHKKVVITAPRGSAKSTVITLGYPLYHIFNKSTKYILIISDSRDQANKLLASIADVLYPLGIEEQSSNRLIFRDKLIESLGTGCRIRGRRFKQHRPQLIILDDPQGHLDLISQSTRDAHWDWFMRDLVPSGSKNCEYVVVGTTIHRDSIVHKLGSIWPSLRFAALKMPNRLDLWEQWVKLPLSERSAFYRANKREMTEGSELLWEDRWCLEQLMTSYFELGADAFNTEYLQIPGHGVRSPVFAHYLDSCLIDELPYDAFCELISCDPSFSTKTSADYTSVTCIFRSNSYQGVPIIKSYVQKGNWVDFVASKAMEYKPSKLVVESNATMGLATQVVADALQPIDWELEIVSKHWHEPKHTRIMSSILPRLIQQQILITRDSSELVSELMDYPNCRHDDALDSLALGLFYTA